MEAVVEGELVEAVEVEVAVEVGDEAAEEEEVGMAMEKVIMEEGAVEEDAAVVAAEDSRDEATPRRNIVMRLSRLRFLNEHEFTLYLLFMSLA